ncbi:MAG: hypothetical protein AAFN81_30690 [Bacteroidota bacterium]
MISRLLLVILFVMPFWVQAQFATLPVNQAESQWYENGLLHADSNRIHTAIRPFRRSDVRGFNRRQELLPDSIQLEKGVFPWLKRKLLYEQLFSFQGEDYTVNIQPVVGFLLGTESESADYDDIYQNTRGLRIEGQLGEKFSFYTTVVESQGRFPAHFNTLTQQLGVVPAYWRRKSFRTRGSDFAYAAGEIAYTPSKFFHFRLGRGKQFIGEGYRSMLISDNSINYPFFRIETTIGKLRYVNVWAIMNDIRPEVELADDVYARKYLSMHYLSLNIGQRLNVGLFEGIMWGDELNRFGFDANFLNPVILYRPVEFASGFAGGNTLIGINGSYQLAKGLKAYGQVAIDEFTFSEIRDWSNGPWQNMLAWQLGAKWGDAFGIRNLFLRAEYNAARPHTYSHRDIITNWGHYNQPLAHPLGGNFRELLFHAQYRRGRWLGSLAIHTALLGRDENRDANWGGDIYKSFLERSADEQLFIGSGVESELTYWRAELAYVLNPLYNLRLRLGAQYRTETATAVGLPTAQNIFFGVQTNMYTLYQDY